MTRILERGIRANLPQFALLVGTNALVGALVGQERSLIPLLAEREFGLASGLATSLFLVTFGLAKAPSNLVAGLLAERFGPRRVLVTGWLVGLPVPLLLMWAPSWNWVVRQLSGDERLVRGFLRPNPLFQRLRRRQGTIQRPSGISPPASHLEDIRSLRAWALPRVFARAWGRSFDVDDPE